MNIVSSKTNVANTSWIVSEPLEISYHPIARVSNRKQIPGVKGYDQEMNQVVIEARFHQKLKYLKLRTGNDLTLNTKSKPDHEVYGLLTMFSHAKFAIV